MRKIIEIVLFAGIIFTIILYASLGFAWYAVVNADNSIHTVEERPTEKLTNERVRYEIDAKDIPQKLEQYEWRNGFAKKKSDVIAAEKEEREKPARIIEKIDAQIKLSAISELEKTDSEDYSFEKQKYEKIIQERK